MATQPYHIKSGKRVPGTTTIIGRFKDSGALIKWAYSQGREHGALSALGKPAPESLYEVSKNAADIGTVAHSMVEASIKGEDPYKVPGMLMLSEEQQGKACSSFDAYTTWARMSRLEIVHTEVPLISEEYAFGGTLDAIGRIDGKLCLVDWKTSNAIYGDYLLQLAAYAQLWHENREERLHGFHLCRFSKEFGDFSHHHYSDLSEAWEMFKHLRSAYDLDARLKKRAA